MGEDGCSDPIPMGVDLALDAILQSIAIGTPVATAVDSHCFKCSKKATCTQKRELVKHLNAAKGMAESNLHTEALLRRSAELEKMVTRRSNSYDPFKRPERHVLESMDEAEKRLTAGSRFKYGHDKRRR